MSYKIIAYIASILVMYFIVGGGGESSKRAIERSIDPRLELFKIVQEKDCSKLLYHIDDSINFRDDVRNKQEFIEYWYLDRDCKSSELWESWESLIIASYMHDSCYSQNFIPSCMEREADLLRVIRETSLYKDSLLTDSVGVLTTYKAFRIQKVIYPKENFSNSNQVKKWVFQVICDDGVTGFISNKNIYNYNGGGYIEFKVTSGQWIITSGS